MTDTQKTNVFETIVSEVNGDHKMKKSIKQYFSSNNVRTWLIYDITFSPIPSLCMQYALTMLALLNPYLT